MPLFDLKCKKCNHVSEQSSNREIACPECGSPTYQTFENWHGSISVPWASRAVNDSELVPNSAIFNDETKKKIVSGELKRVGKDDF